MADFEIPENPDFVESVRKFEPTDPAHADLFNRVILALLESLAYLRKYKADMDYVDLSYQQATGYADKIVAALINGAPEMLNTLDKLANAVEENASIIDVLVAAIGKKAEQVELDTHTGNNVIHITSAEHEGLTEAIKHTKTEHVTGVKGSAESIYRTGDVEITAENVGAVSRKEFDELNIGGTNLFQGTKEFEITNAKSFSNSVSSVTSETYNGLKIRKNLTAWNFYRPILSLESGNYVFSGYVKGVNDLPANIQVNAGDTILNAYTFSITSDWKRYSITFEITEKSDVTFYLESRKSGEIYECGWKLEKGNKATDWSPAPEDLAPVSGSQHYVKVFNSENVNHSDNLTVNDLADQGFAAAMIAATEDSPIGSGWFHVLNLGWDNSKNNWVSQIALGTQPNDGLYYRTTGASIAGKPWKRVLDSSNYTNYALKNENLSDIDLNNVTTTGIYHLAGNLVNNPESCNATLIVDFNVGTPYQLFIPDYNYRLYKRVKSNGNWSSWTSLFTWNNLEGKPVAREIGIGTASNFGDFYIDNQSSEGNTLKILNTMYLHEYCTFGGIQMSHYKIIVWADLPHIDSSGYCEFYIGKGKKIIKPRTSETELPSTTVNVSPLFDLQVMYGDNDKRNELDWFNEDDGKILLIGTNGTYCFYIDCWA